MLALFPDKSNVTGQGAGGGNFKLEAPRSDVLNIRNRGWQRVEDGNRQLLGWVRQHHPTFWIAKQPDGIQVYGFTTRDAAVESFTGGPLFGQSHVPAGGLGLEVGGDDNGK